MKINYLKILITFICIFVDSICLGELKPRIVGLVAVRNERNIIEQCLKALSRYTDAIVCLDDCSTDDTVKIMSNLSQECNIEKIITKKNWYRDEPGDRNLLLAEGRAIGGTHFIVLDADEMFSANCMNNNFLRQRILQLRPAEAMEFSLISLWRSVDYFRNDNSVWSNNYGAFVFCDDGTSNYSSDFLHTGRCPGMTNLKLTRLHGHEYCVLHFQFVSWQNLIEKQSWYKCLERIRNPEKSIEWINNIYGRATNESGLRTSRCPSYWFSNYSFFDPLAYSLPVTWRRTEILEWFAKYGIDTFKDIDIWNIDWLKKYKIMSGMNYDSNNE